VTIRTKKADLPTEFPPARLFLDDVEEIVRTLIDASKSSQGHEEEKIILKFAIKDQVCDEVEELPKIAKKTIDLSIQLNWEETGLLACTLTFSRNTSTLFSFGSEEEHLTLFHKLAPIFKRRNLWVATLARSYPNLFGALTFLLCCCAAFPLLILLGKQIPSMRAILIGLPSAAIIISVLSTSSHHNTIILRPSSEPSPLRQGLLQKILLVVITSVLTFLLTMLGFYLKHKYWP